jgi:hypothetical protein
MMTMRDDVHAPSAIIPEDYEYVAQECMKIEGLGDCSLLMAAREQIRAHMTRTGGTYSGHEHGGNCMVCGSVNAIYTVLFHHAKTNTYVRMGQDCAAKCEMGDERAFKAFKAGIDDARKLHAGKTKAKAILAEQGLERAWSIYETACKDNSYFDKLQEERTVHDIVGKLVQYGSLSDKQMDFLRGLLTRIDTRAERMAQREQERAAALPCPSGRLEVIGTVLSVKEQESDFGPCLKMTVKTDAGWVCYGTVPSSLVFQPGLKHGDRIKFTAAFTPSDRDIKFGFFKRPTCAALIGAGH